MAVGGRCAVPEDDAPDRLGGGPEAERPDRGLVQHDVRRRGLLGMQAVLRPVLVEQPPGDRRHAVDL